MGNFVIYVRKFNLIENLKLNFSSPFGCLKVVFDCNNWFMYTKFNPLMPGGTKRPHILKQTCNWKPQL